MTLRAASWSILSTLVSLLAIAAPCHADPVQPAPRLGSQEVALAVGPMLPWRVKPAQSTKLFGLGAMPSWSMTLTDSIGSGWYAGQLRLGVELVALRTHEPVHSGSIGVTPKMTYALTSLGPWRPFVEGGGGPLWSELGGRVPEQPAAFNFVVMGGGGLSYFLTSQLALNLGGRFYHISNGGTRSTNRGLNFGFPYVGFSWFLF